MLQVLAKFGKEFKGDTKKNFKQFYDILKKPEDDQFTMYYEMPTELKIGEYLHINITYNDWNRETQEIEEASNENLDYKKQIEIIQSDTKEKVVYQPIALQCIIINIKNITLAC